MGSLLDKAKEIKRNNASGNSEKSGLLDKAKNIKKAQVLQKRLEYLDNEYNRSQANFAPVDTTKYSNQKGYMDRVHQANNVSAYADSLRQYASTISGIDHTEINKYLDNVQRNVRNQNDYRKSVGDYMSQFKDEDDFNNYQKYSGSSQADIDARIKELNQSISDVNNQNKDADIKEREWLHNYYNSNLNWLTERNADDVKAQIAEVDAQLNAYMKKRGDLYLLGDYNDPEYYRLMDEYDTAIEELRIQKNFLEKGNETLSGYQAYMDAQKQIEDLKAQGYKPAENYGGALLNSAGQGAYDTMINNVMAFTDATLGKPLRFLEDKTIGNGLGHLIGKGYDWTDDISEIYKNQSLIDSTEYDSGIEKFGMGASNVIASALPTIAIAVATGGVGAATGAKSIGTYLKSLAKNPQYWASFVNMGGATYDSAIEEGATYEEALASALLNGAIGAATEVGSGFEKKLTNSNTFKNWLTSALEEGGEEVIQGVLENGIKKGVYDHDREWISGTDENAVINPIRMAQEFGYGALAGGVLSGFNIGASSAVNAGVNTYQQNKAYKEIGQDIKGSESLDAYTQYAMDNKLIKSADKISDVKMGKVAEKVETDIKQSMMNASSLKELTDAYDKVSKYNDSELTAFATHHYIQKVREMQNGVTGENSAHTGGFTANATTSPQNSENVLEMANSHTDKGVDGSAQTANVITSSGNKASITGIVEVNDGDAVVSLSDGTIAKVSELEIANKEFAKVWAYALSHNNTNLAKNITSNFAMQTYADDYIHHYKNMLSVGRMGLDYKAYEAITEVAENRIGVGVAYSAYSFGNGRFGTEETVEAVKPSKKSKAQYTKEEGVQDSPMDTIYEGVSKKLGIEIKKVKKLFAGEDAEANAQLVVAAASIMVSENADNEHVNFIHELGEGLLAYNPKAYADLRKAVLEYAVEIEGVGSLDQLIKKKQKMYAEVEGSETYTEAMNEVVNDILGGMFASDEGVKQFTDWLQDKSGYSVKEQKTFLQKLCDLLKSIADAIKNFIKSGKVNEANIIGLKMQGKRAMEIRSQFLKALEGMKENIEQGNGVTEESAEIIRNSIKTVGDITYTLVEAEEVPTDNPEKSITRRVRDFFTKHYRNHVLPLGKTKSAYINKTSGNEYTNPAKFIDDDLFHGKMLAATELENLLKGSKFLKWGKDDGRHPDAVRGWNKYLTYYAVNVDGEYQVYSGVVSIKRIARGDLFYDITKIKNITTGDIGQTIKSHAESESNVFNNIINNSSGNDNTEITNSLKDSEGTMLTDAQIDYFKDSQIKDSNGNLKVMYHGSGESFTVFDKKKAKSSGYYGSGFYFTESESHAKQYGSNYKVYLNITNPMQQGTNDITKAQLKKFVEAVADNEDYGIENYGYGATVDSVVNNVYGKDDFAMIMDINASCIGDMVEAIQLFNEVNGTSYDGIVVPTETVAFYPNQIKNVDNLNPTENEDIRYSLKDAEEGKNLIAVHNIRSDNLLSVMELGGFPMPSVAITKYNVSHNGYGDISVILRPSAIDPESNDDNKVYSADAYTPRFPSTAFKLNSSKLVELAEKLDTSSSMLEANEFSYGNLNDVISQFSRNNKVRELFVKEKGYTVNPVLRPRKFNDNYIRYATEFVLSEEFSFDKLVNDLDYRNKYFEEIKEKTPGVGTKAFKQKMIESHINTINGIFDEAAKDKGLFEEIKKEYETDIEQLKGKEVLVEDAYSYEDGLRNLVNEKNDEFKNFITELINPVIKSKYLRNNKNYYTSTGNPRSFDSLHEPYTAENAVKIMRENSDTNAEGGVFGHGIGELRAALSKKYNSIDEMHEDESKISVEFDEDIQAKYEECSATLNDICDKLVIKNSADNFLMAHDSASAVVLEALRKTKKAEGIYNYIKKNYKNPITMELATRIENLAKNIMELPVKYFEAKPQRVVGFDEVYAVIIPDNSSEQLKTVLEKNGIEFMEYEAGNEEARKATINVLEDIRFSLKEDAEPENSNNLDQSEMYKAQVEALSGIFEVTKGKKVKTSSLRSVASMIRKRYNSTYDYNHLVNGLRIIYDYASSGKVAVNDLMAMTQMLSKLVLQESANNREISAEAKALLNDIKATRIMLSDAQKEEIAYYYDSFNEYRKKNFGKLTIANNGTSLDTVWKQFSETHPEWFDADVSELDQPMRLAEIVQALSEDYRSEEGFDIEDASTYMALELFNSYFIALDSQISEKHKTEINRLKSKYSTRMDKIKKQAKEKYEAKLQEVKQADRERLAKLRTTKNAKLEEQRAKFAMKKREAVHKVRENAAKAKVKKSILKNAKDIITWINAPTDKKHVPEPFRKVTLDFLTSIDFVSANAKPDSQNTLRWKDKMDRLKMKLMEVESSLNSDNETEYDAIINDIDPDLVPMITDFITKNEGKANISELDVAQLEELSKIVKSLKAAIVNANKMYANKMAESVAEIGNASIEQMGNLREKRLHGGLAEGIHGLLNVEMLDSKSYFGMLGEAASSIHQELRDGFSKRVFDIKDAQEYMNEVLKGIKTKKWTGNNAEIHTFKDADGKEFKMTTAQLMSLYCLSKREQALGHIYGGGIKIENINATKKISQIKAFHIDEQMLADMVKVLTPEQIKVADAMQEYLSTTASEWGNEVSMQMFGYKKFTEKNYFPIKSYDNNLATNDKTENKNGSLYAIRNQGMTKATVKNANNALVISDVFDVFTDHIVGMANYHAFAIPLSDAMKWYNYKVGTKTEERLDTYSVKESIERAYGNKAKAYFTNLIRNINGEVAKGTSTDIPNLLMSKYKASTVAANIRVVIQQPTAYFRAMNIINPKHLAKGVIGVNSWKDSFEECNKYSAIGIWKSWGYYETLIGKSMKEVITGQQTVYDAIQDATMKPAQLADNLTWGLLWNAVKSEQMEAHPDMDIHSEEFMELVSARFDEVIDTTQVVDTVLHKSQIMRSGDGLVKLGTAFMAEPTKSYNIVHNQMMKIWQNPKSKEAWMGLTRATSTFVITALFTAVAQSMVDTFRYRDEEEYEKWIEQYVNELKDNFIDNVNPLGLIPYAKDLQMVISALFGEEYYESSRMDTAALTQVATFITQMKKYISGDSNYTLAYMIKSGSKVLSYITGIPFYNVFRTINTLYDNVAENPLPMKTSDKDAKEFGERIEQLEKGTANFEDLIEAEQEEYLEDYPTASDEKAKDHGISAVRSKVTAEYKEEYINAFKRGYTSRMKEIKKNIETSGLYDDVDDTLMDWLVSSLRTEYLKAKTDAERTAIRQQLWKTGKWKTVRALDKQIEEWRK